MDSTLEAIDAHLPGIDAGGGTPFGDTAIWGAGPRPSEALSASEHCEVPSVRSQAPAPELDGC